MNNYSINSDSPRWWWPQAAVGGVVAAAISAILVVPATGVAQPGAGMPDRMPADSWLTAVDPATDGPCFLVRARWNDALDQPQPRCGHAPATDQEQWTGARRPGLGFRP